MNAIFENVVTDSIKSDEVSVQVKNAAAGKLAIRDGAKNGTVLAECDLSTAKAAANGWFEANCGTLKSKTGIKDFYLTASGVSGEAIVGNIMFKSNTPESSSSSVSAESSSSGVDISSSSSGTTAIGPRAVRSENAVLPARKGYHDLKGRRFDKQIPYRVMF